MLRTETLPTRRLDDTTETSGLDLLKIDTRGGELMVLRHATDRLREAVAIQTEVEFLEMYEGQPLFAEVDGFLRDLGFVFHRFAPAVSRTIKPMLTNNDPYAGLSQLVWADAIFVRDFVHPEAMSPTQLLRLVVIVHDCYRSYDLALHLLLEHDRRTGTNVGPTLIAAIAAEEGSVAAPVGSGG